MLYKKREWQVPTLTFVPLIYFSKCHSGKNNHPYLQLCYAFHQDSLAPAGHTLPRKRKGDSKNLLTLLSPFPCSFPLLLQRATVLPSSLYFCFSRFGVFPPASPRARPEILSRSPAWPSLRTIASPSPLRPGRTGFRDTPTKEESPPCLPQFLTTSAAESRTGAFPPAAATGGEGSTRRARRGCGRPGFPRLDKPVTSSTLTGPEPQGSTAPLLVQHPAQQQAPRRLETLPQSWVWR